MADLAINQAQRQVAQTVHAGRRERLLADMRRDGFVVVRGVLNSRQVQELLEAAQTLTRAARAGHWPHVRTFPKQFPPWTAADAVPKGIWGVQHLLHPALYKDGGLSGGAAPPLTRKQACAFAGLYFAQELLALVEVLLQIDAVPDQDCGASLMMELFNMLVAPPQDFALRWHRDTVSFNLAIDEEAAGLETARSSSCGGRYTFVQYNMPLVPDSSLHVVPGSHTRSRLPDEARVLAADPYADTLPGWVAVPLDPGDVVFYDNNLIHRGVYSAGTERYTLHGSVSRAPTGSADGSTRARNILQHSLHEWVGAIDWEELFDKDVSSGTSNDVRQNAAALCARAREMQRRLVALGADSHGIQYAHAD